MSRFLTKADELAAYLSRVVGLESVTWEVARPKDLESEYARAAEKMLGLGVIDWAAGSNPDRNSKALRISSQFNITLFFKPSLRDQLPDGADITELAATAIHHWWPEETPTKRLVRFEVTGLDAVADDDFQAFRIACECVVQFPEPDIQLLPES